MKPSIALKRVIINHSIGPCDCFGNSRRCGWPANASTCQPHTCRFGQVGGALTCGERLAKDHQRWIWVAAEGVNASRQREFPGR
jgi:hypothetical protein